MHGEHEEKPDVACPSALRRDHAGEGEDAEHAEPHSEHGLEDAGARATEDRHEEPLST